MTPAQPGDDLFAGSIVARRLGVVVTDRLEHREHVVAWGRAWVSRDGPLSVLFAARTRDFVVLTDRRVMLWSTGFVSRMPQRRVMVNRLVSVRVEPVEGRYPDRSIRVLALHRNPLRFDFGGDDQSRRLVAALYEACADEATLARVRALESPEEPE